MVKKSRWICPTCSFSLLPSMIYSVSLCVLYILQEVEVIQAVQDSLQKTLEHTVEQIR